MDLCMGCGERSAAATRARPVFPEGDEVDLCLPCVTRVDAWAADRSSGDHDYHRVVALPMRLAGETWTWADQTIWFERPLRTYFPRLRARA